MQIRTVFTPSFILICAFYIPYLVAMVSISSTLLDNSGKLGMDVLVLFSLGVKHSVFHRYLRYFVESCEN